MILLGMRDFNFPPYTMYYLQIALIITIKFQLCIANSWFLTCGIILVITVWMCSVNVLLHEWTLLNTCVTTVRRELWYSICALPNPFSCKWNKICLNQVQLLIKRYPLSTLRMARKKCSDICPLRESEPETMALFLFWCSKLSNIRQQYLAKIMSYCEQHSADLLVKMILNSSYAS